MQIDLRGGLRVGDTAGSVLKRNNGVGPGFEFLRYALAIAVLLSHLSWLVGTSAHDAIMQAPTPAGGPISSPVSNGWFQGLTDWKGVLRALLVPSFFALSGFLVMGSALRVRRVSTFLAFRALRIVPALGVEVTLSALVLGPALTVLTLRQYIHDPLLPAYFLNIVGHPQYILPGLFTHNPVQLVNGNLWTLPGEFICYFVMAVLMGIGVVYSRKLLTFTFLVSIITLGVGNPILLFDVNFQTVSVYSLPMYFFSGVILFIWKEKIPARADVFLLSSILSVLLISDNRTVYLASIPVAYCTVLIGLYRVPAFWILNSGDYSYGIYLYGAPLTQTLINLFPLLKGHVGYTAVPAVLLTYIFAFGSWHLVEKHFLKLKKRLPERWFPRHRKLVPPSVGNIQPSLTSTDNEFLRNDRPTR